MNYETIRLDKSMYKSEGGFSRTLERLDPSGNYRGTELAGLDAFERQLKRFDIKVSGQDSDVIAKFFQTSDSANLFPEYISRAVAQGAKDSGVLGDIVASKTNINSMDYRSIRTDLSNIPISDSIAEGGEIPETNIVLNENLVKMKKRGRLLCASYEAIRFQHTDVLTVSLKHIGAHIVKTQVQDAVALLINGEGSVPAAEKLTSAGTALAYSDLLALWNKFEDFEMNVMLCSPDMAIEVLGMSEFKDPHSGLGFQNTGSLAAPMGAKLIKSGAVPSGKIIALDKRFALEMVCAGDISVEYDKLINTQLERAAVTAVYGFSKIFPDAVKVLERKA